MTLQQIECFLELAETLNYTVTAQKMFISQPAVSKHIQTLEADLGFKLIDRSIAGVSFSHRQVSHYVSV